MTRDEFLRIITARGISDDAFSFSKNQGECYVLSGKFGRWNVYYSERGLKTNVRDFTSESDALEYLFDELTDDPTTKQGN